MNNSKNKNDRDEIFNPETAMPYWLKYNPKDFIQTIVHEIREEASYVKVYMKAFEDDPDIASHPIKSIWGPRTVEENSVEIRKHLDKIQKILTIAWEYSQGWQTQNPKSET